MKAKQRAVFDKWQIEEMDPQDIRETILRSKQIVKQLPIKKYHRSGIRPILEVLCYHMPKVLLLEGVLCLGILLYIGMAGIAENSMNVNAVYYGLTFTGILCMIGMSGEMLRVKLMDTWELERTCAMRLERILVIKMLILGSFSIVVIFLLTLTSWALYGISFLRLACFGYVPFLFLTALILQVAMHLDSKEGILGVYTLGISLYMAALPVLHRTLSQLLVLALCVIAFLFFFYTLKQFYDRADRNWGGSLC